MTRIEWDKDWPKRMDKEIHDFMVDLSNSVLNDMVAGCPIDSGELVNDLDAQVIGKDARVGAATVPHAIYAEEGAGPHEIWPNTKKALWWEGAGHPRVMVNHPGMEGAHFMKGALYRERTGL